MKGQIGNPNMLRVQKDVIQNIPAKLALQNTWRESTAWVDSRLSLIGVLVKIEIFLVMFIVKIQEWFLWTEIWKRICAVQESMKLRSTKAEN